MVNYQTLETMADPVVDPESHWNIKQSFPATDLSVIKCVGISQSGEWMSNKEVMGMMVSTLLFFKSGDHHPLSLWMLHLALVATA